MGCVVPVASSAARMWLGRVEVGSTGAGRAVREQREVAEERPACGRHCRTLYVARELVSVCCSCPRDGHRTVGHWYEVLSPLCESQHVR